MSAAEVALVVSTYQKPYHLQRVLTSIEAQTGVEGKFEVVVTDDGSTDETESMVDQFSRRVHFPVRFVTHPHRAFQLARCRNKGFAATTAPYVVFLDGDCVIPPDHLRKQLKHRRRRVVMGGYCCRLDESTSKRITVDAVLSGRYLEWIPTSELLKLEVLAWKSSFYNLIRHPTKPRLFGGNISIWREDFERVNGFDEKFVGWGGEDDDMRFRLRRAGIRIRSILHWTRTYHLWHPPEPSTPNSISDGVNVEYLNRRGRLTRCVRGLRKRSLCDLRARIFSPVDPASDRRLAPLRKLATCHNDRCPEIEVVCHAGREGFSGEADVNLLVVLRSSPQIASLARIAHCVVSDEELPQIGTRRVYPLEALDQALRDAA